MTTEPIVQLEDLRRSFTVRKKVGRLRRQTKVVHAVDGISASIQPGEAVGYIGANGAGKSTTIKMLTGILVPSSGRVRTCGYDPVPQRRRLAREIGVVFGQRSQLWWDLPLRDSFRILGAIHRLPTEEVTVRTEQLIDHPDWLTYWTRPYGNSRWASACEARWRRRWSIAPGCWCSTSPPLVWT
jgi:ABC-2 type transport system ATP-binding protein